MKELKKGDKFYAQYGSEHLKWKVIAVSGHGVLAKWCWYSFKKFFTWEDLIKRTFIKV